MGKYTQSDIKRLADEIRRRKENHPEKPFNLLTGAGCSKTAGIPLARELVTDMNREFKAKIRRKLNTETERQDYGQCMSCLSKSDRRRLLEPHLKKAGINWAHLAIATMMEAGFIDRVLTFNFDSVLAKACGLVGLYPATYDFVSGKTEKTDFIAKTAILHLHGQGHGMALLNTGKETQEHAQNLKPLLRETFERAPLIVVGYSGDSDAVFPVLKDEYDGKHDLYWAGYDQDPSTRITTFLDKGENSSEYLGEADADQFLIGIARELGCFPPKLFRNPYQHLLDELKPVVKFPLSEDYAIDHAEDLRAQLKTDVKRTKETQKSAPPSLTDLAIKGEWAKIRKLGISENTSREDKKIIATAYWMKGGQLGDQGNETQKGRHFTQALEAYNKANSLDPNRHQILYNWGFALVGMAELPETTNKAELFKQATEKYEQAVDIKPDDHHALYNWGFALAGMAKLPETKNKAELFKQATEKYKQAVDIKPDDHKALNNWGFALVGMAELPETKNKAELFKQATEKYKQAVDIKPDTHQALNNWGFALVGMAELPETTNKAELFKQATEKYEQAVDIKPDDHHALYNWGFALAGMAKLPETKNKAELFKQATEKYKQAVDIKPDDHKALNNWGFALVGMAELPETKNKAELFKQATEKYKQAVDIKPDTHQALNNWGSALMELYEIDSDKKYLDQALEILLRAQKIEPDMVYNLACVYARLGDAGECRVNLEHCQDKGTLPDTEHLKTDNDLQSVQDKDWFKDLLKA